MSKVMDIQDKIALIQTIGALTIEVQTGRKFSRSFSPAKEAVERFGCPSDIKSKADKLIWLELLFASERGGAA